MSEEVEELDASVDVLEPGDHPDWPTDEEVEAGLQVWREVDDLDDFSNGMDEGGEDE